MLVKVNHIYCRVVVDPPIGNLVNGVFHHVELRSDQGVAEPEGRCCKLVEDVSRASGVVSDVAFVTTPDVELVGQLRAQNSWQELVESDVLVEGYYNFPGLLKQLLVVPVGVLKAELVYQLKSMVTNDFFSFAYALHKICEGRPSATKISPEQQNNKNTPVVLEK